MNRFIPCAMLVGITIAGCGGEDAANLSGVAPPVEASGLAAQRKAFDDGVNTLVEQKDYDSLLAECDAYIDKDPTYARAYVARSLAWHAKNEIAKVIADRTTALSLLSPSEKEYRCELHWSLGMTFMERGQYGQATAHFDALVGLIPTHEEAHRYLAICRYETGDFDKALGNANQSIEIDPDEALSYALRGKIWMALGDHKKAQVDRRHASELSRDQETP